MAKVVSLQDLIGKSDILQKPTEEVSSYLREHPAVYKTALLVNHVFRAVSMTAFNLLLPFSIPANMMICFAGSLFYRLTVETHCAYKFAMPAFAGSIAFSLAQTTVAALVSGVAFASLGGLAMALATALPMIGYFVYVIPAVSHEVDTRLKKT
jgi:hypothetical protein